MAGQEVIEVTAILPKRGQDSWGSGAFGASRGNRTHRGVDLACHPGTTIYAPVDGIITKIGFPYEGDWHYRYVQITDELQRDWRIFYIAPNLPINTKVRRDLTELGVAQDIAGKYGRHRAHGGRMKNHVHIEVRESGVYLDPDSVDQG